MTIMHYDQCISSIQWCIFMHSNWRALAEPVCNHKSWVRVQIFIITHLQEAAENTLWTAPFFCPSTDVSFRLFYNQMRWQPQLFLIINASRQWTFPQHQSSLFLQSFFIQCISCCLIQAETRDLLLQQDIPPHIRSACYTFCTHEQD